MKKLSLFVFINTILVLSAFGQSDGCSSATSITMNATCVPTAGTTTGATQTIAGCAGTSDDDVWYQFTATATSVQIIVTAGDASFDPVVQLFSGSCSTLISLACTDNTFGGGTETVNYSGLTIGQTYRVRVYHYYTGSGSGNFTICVKNAPAPPSNDDCTGATALPVNVACSYTNATTDGASESQLGCAGNADDDVWFSFVATNSLQNVLVHPIDNLDLVFEVFEGGCGSLNTLLCQDNGFTNDDEQSDLVGLTPGQTYFVRVYDYYGGVTGDFQICVTGAATPAPVNDEPCTAIALPTVTSECNYGFFTTTGATASLGAPTPSSCVGGSGAAIGGFSGSSHDVWFSVVVPSSGSLDIIPEPNGGAGTISDGVMALYSGTCGALTQIACADDYNYPGSSNDLLPLITATGLTPGSTVYIRYWGFGSSFGDFGLCVTTTTNDDCANALYICDPNGYSGSTSPAYTPDRPSNMHGNNETSTGVNLANGIDSGGPFGDGQPWDMSYSFSGSPALDVNIENNSWIKFTASATTVTLNVSIYDCWVGSYPSGGIQMQIFEATNCTNFIPVSNFAENSSGFVLTANGLTIGQDYYLMIDGYAGDICSYTISANSGVQFPDITPSSATICQNDAITLTAPPGATSYLWPHSGETTQSVTVNPPTTQTYVCEVTGLCDHKQTLSSVVTVNPVPNLTGGGVTSNSPICNGGNAIFTITGSPNSVVTYNINGGASQTVNIGASGSTTVNVNGVSSNQTINLTDIAYSSTSCNSTLSASSTVVVNPNPNITSIVGTDPTSCGGNDGYITISGLTASTNYNVSYDDGGSTVGPSSMTSNASGEIIITGLSQGNYNNFVVQLASTSCSTTDNTSISLSDPSSPTINSVASSNPTTCSGTDGTVTLSGLNNNTTYAVTYDDNGTSVGPVNLTSNGSGQIIITGLDAGTYNNFVVNLVGCTGSNNTSAVLSDPALPTLTGSGVTSNSPICSGNNAIFTITGSPTATVTYTINGGANQTVVLDAAGNGTVTITGATADQTILLSDITFTSTNCSTTLNNTLTVTVNPNPTFTSLTSNTPICSGDDAIFTLSGSANATVTYTINGGGNQTVVLDGSGNGTVTVSGATANQTLLLSDIAFASGCNTTINNTTTVTVNPNPNITSIVGTNPTSCGGNDGFITISGLTASTNYNVSYDDGGTTIGPSSMTSNASGEIIITGLSQGNYNNFVLQFPLTSCSTTDNTSISLSDPGSPVINSITSTNPTSCSGTDGTVTLSGLNNNTTYAVTYDDNGTSVGPVNLTSNGSGQIIITGLDAGTYNNFVVDLVGCTGSNNTSAVLSDPALPTLTGSGVTSNSPICSGNNAIFTITGSPNATVTYTINGGSNQTVVLNGAGNGTVTITGATADQTILLSDITFTSTNCSTTLNNTLTVTVNPNPTFTSLTSNTPICSGDDAIFTLSGSANATVTYTINGGANQTVVLDGSGNGTVTVTGATSDQTILLSDIAFASGCNTVINNTTTVTVNPNPNITSIVGTDPTSCGGNDGYITISGLTASTNYNVSYDDGGTTVGPSVITSNASGEIIITGLSQGNYNNFVLQFPSTSCSTTDNTSISLSDPGSPVINSITSTNPTSCSGTDGTITISGLTANTTYNLTYDDDGTTVGPISTTTNALGEISITGLNAGTYNNFNVEITGCSVSDNTSINITDPSSPTISGVVNSNPTTCGGSDGSITLSGLTTNTTYDVTYDLGGVTQGPFSLTSNASGDIVIANLSQGTYDNFTVTVPLTGCSGSDNTQTVLSDPGTPTVSGITNTNTTTCGGTDGTITISGLTANTAYNITYDDDGTTVGPTSITTDANGDIIISNLDAGAYNNFSVELAGCTTNDNTTLNISDPTPPSVDAGNPTLSICDGTAITLTATNPDVATITWDNGVSDGTSFTPSVGTIMYTVTATNTTTNCMSTDSIEVTVNPEPQIDLTTAVVVDENCTDGGQVSGIITTNGSPNYTYQWIDGTTTIANTANVTGLTAGNYSLIVTDAQGCDDTTNVTINFINNAVVIAIDDSASTTGINEVTFDVYPNDTGDETSITVVIQPENGSVVENGNGQMTYTPNQGFSGVDTLTYFICDPNCINTCDTAIVFITVKKIDSLIIPNGFTPNDDNINDYFVIKNLEQYPNNNIIIFNRWGDIVYTSEPYNNDWDGTSKNSNIIVAGDKVVDGTYFFVLDIGVEGKEKISGYIDLRRK